MNFPTTLRFAVLSLQPTIPAISAISCDLRSAPFCFGESHSTRRTAKHFSDSAKKKRRTWLARRSVCLFWGAEQRVPLKNEGSGSASEDGSAILKASLLFERWPQRKTGLLHWQIASSRSYGDLRGQPVRVRIASTRMVVFMLDSPSHVKISRSLSLFGLPSPSFELSGDVVLRIEM